MATPFEEFVNRELPRRSAHLTNAITSYDGDPNDGAAPAIIQSAPLGTWYHEESEGRWWRKSLVDWVLGGGESTTRSYWDLYVDSVNGDDANDGSSGSPIQTLEEMGKRVNAAIAGTGINVYLAAGDYRVPDLYGIKTSARFTVTNAVQVGVNIEGAFAVDETFTIASSNLNVITASGSPGWTTDEHAGKVIRWDVGGGNIRTRFIWSNTADTLTIALTPSSMSGYYDLPTSGDLDIETLESRILPSLANPNYNGFMVNGMVSLKHIAFDGTAGYNQGPAGKISLTGCSFKNYRYGFMAFYGAVFPAACWFEDCSVAALHTLDYCYLGPDVAFRNCGKGVRVYRGDLELRSWGSFFIDTVPTFVEAQRGATVLDETTQAWIDGGVTTYISAEEQTRVTRDYREAKIWPGQAQPGTYLSLATGSRATIHDSAAATMTGSTAYVNIGGDAVSHSDYVAAGLGESDENGNLVAG